MSVERTVIRATNDPKNRNYSIIAGYTITHRRGLTKAQTLELNRAEVEDLRDKLNELLKKPE